MRKGSLDTNREIQLDSYLISRDEYSLPIKVFC